MLVLE